MTDPLERLKSALRATAPIPPGTARERAIAAALAAFDRYYAGSGNRAVHDAETQETARSGGSATVAVGARPSPPLVPTRAARPPRGESARMKTAAEMHSRLVARAVEDGAFRAHLLSDPKRAVEKELDIAIPEGFTVKVHEESATTAHLVLPPPARLSEDELAAAAGGDMWAGGTTMDPPMD